MSCTVYYSYTLSTLLVPLQPSLINLVSAKYHLCYMLHTCKMSYHVHVPCPTPPLQVCGDCKKQFTQRETKHHCRACGEGFCDGCCSKSMPVPWRGWGSVPVKVCTACYNKHHRGTSSKFSISENTYMQVYMYIRTVPNRACQDKINDHVYTMYMYVHVSVFADLCPVSIKYIHVLD